MVVDDARLLGVTDTGSNPDVIVTDAGVVGADTVCYYPTQQRRL
jgi:hypothetical protein